jgi:small conductance mechanosensitive channel
MLGLGRFSRARQAFESRTEVWREVGLGAEIDRRQVRRAKGEVFLSLALIAVVLFAFDHRADLFPGLGAPLRIVTVAVLVILGWALARALGRSFAPAMFRRMDPGTAGSVGFLIRLVTLALVAAVALRVAGLNAGTLAVGGAFTAVVLGLAAQQTIANLFAGLVLISTRPFRVGERVRLVGGALAGQLEGIVGSLGLFYTALVAGADRILIPNSMILNLAIIPLREPERVELRVRFGGEITPTQLESRLADAITVPTRYPPHIAVEELDGDEVVVKIVVTPERPADGGRLADEVLSVVRNGGGNGSQPETDGA